MALVMHETGGYPVVILRPFTVYGPGQPPTMFVAEAVESAVNALPFRMSEGTQKRDLVYVEEVVSAILASMHAPSIEGRVINIGTGEAHALRDVAALIWKLNESRTPLLIGDLNASSNEMYDTWADVGLAR